MSILDRNVKKVGKTAFRQSLKFTGNIGVWTKYFRNVTFSSYGIEEIRFHLGNLEEMKRLAELNFCQTHIPEESYIVNVKPNRMDIYALKPICLIYAVENIKSHITNGEIFCGIVFNYPQKKFRALKTFLPGKENIIYFYELVDYCLAYGMNTIILEIGGAMQYKNHPEINEGWIEYCKKFQDYPGQSIKYQFSMDIPKNSIHWENAGGNILTQEEVKKIIAYCKERGIEVIPEQPTLSHCDYLLYNHKDLAERKEDPTPDVYCPKNQKALQLSIELLDEIIDVFNPQIIHIGHDEVYTISQCELCKQEDPAKIFADDVNFYNRYLKKKNIKTMIWSDKLLNAKGKAGHEWGGSEQNAKRDDGTFKYHVPATYKSYELLDKDVLIMHWYWMINRDFDEYLLANFNVCYGNFRGVEMINAYKRFNKEIFGFCVSSWAECKDELIQRNGILFHLAYNAMMAWSNDFSCENLEKNICIVSDDMTRKFNEKLNGNSYVTFIHNTDTYKFHEEFVDGFFPIKKDDYAGKYVIRYKNGEIQEVELFYGFNIGFSGNTFNMQLSNIYDCFLFEKSQVLETTYRCKYVKVNEKMYYSFSVLLKNCNVDSWEFIPSENYKVNIKEVRMHIK